MKKLQNKLTIKHKASLFELAIEKIRYIHYQFDWK
jgi:hypothetical protein